MTPYIILSTVVFLFECERTLYVGLLVNASMYVSETMVWKKNERSRIMTAKMDKYRCLLDIRSLYRMPNARIRVLCPVKKRVDERIDGSVFPLVRRRERMKNSRNVESICEIERINWIDLEKAGFIPFNDFLKKKAFMKVQIVDNLEL